MDNTEIENNIYFELSCKPDIWVSFDALNTANVSTYLHRTICENLPSKFEFIQLDKLNSRLKFTNKSTTHNAINEFFCQPTEVQNYRSFIDDTNTIGHLICQNERLDLLERAMEHPEFRSDIRNRNNQSLVEVTPSTNTGREIKWLLKKREFEQTIRDLEDNNRRIRQNNTDLSDQNYSYQGKLDRQCTLITLLKEDYNKLQGANKTLTSLVHDKNNSIQNRNMFITALFAVLCFMFFI